MVYLFIIWWASEITVADSTDKQLVVSLKLGPVIEDTTGLSLAHQPVSTRDFCDIKQSLYHQTITLGKAYNFHCKFKENQEN
jgi:hypothetical protein